MTGEGGGGGPTYLGQLSVSCWAEGSPAGTQLTSEIQRDKEAELIIMKPTHRARGSLSSIGGVGARAFY
jgi:hypothetical protein